MDPLTIAMLVVAGLLGGILSAIVGGAAMVVYPMMIASGVPPQASAIANVVALTPAAMVAALSDYSKLPTFDRNFLRLIFVSVTVAALGAALLLVTPQRVFSFIVPLLLGLATLIFAFSHRIHAFILERAERDGHSVGFSIGDLKLLIPISFYGGYFGAGVGMLTLSVFIVATGGDYRSANVAKNLISGLNGVTASFIFVAQGVVLWPQTLVLMAGTLAGGVIGAHIARRVPRERMRIVVVAVGSALTLLLAKDLWF